MTVWTVSPEVGRLINAVRAVWDLRETREVADIYDELQEMYNAMRAVTGEACEHDWFPKVPYNGPPHRYCGKCGEPNPDIHSDQ